MTLPQVIAAGPMASLLSAPLAAIRPGLMLPAQSHSVAELLADLDQKEGVTPHASHW